MSKFSAYPIERKFGDTSAQQYFERLMKPETYHLASGLIKLALAGEVGDELSVTYFGSDSDGAFDCYLLGDSKKYGSSRRLDEPGSLLIPEGATITLGREHNHGRFDFAPHVSREHVCIRREGNAITVSDLNSTHGTFVAKPIQPYPGTI